MTPVPKMASTSSEPTTPVTYCGDAWHRRVGSLHLLKVSGSAYEMGRQHGVLLKDDVRTGPLPYYKTYIEKLLRTNGAGALAPALASMVQRGVGGRVARAMPEFALDSLRGLAEGADMPYRDLLQGAVMPDSMLWVAARMMKMRKIAPAVRHRLALGLGCSSAIAWGSATKDGRLLHARNFDYHGVGVWPRTAAVMFHDPDDGQRYVSVGAAGVLLGGVTAMNEAGLTLTVHQHMFTDATTLGGTPIGVVGDIVMRKAHNLDEAEAILRQHTPIGCWTYLISDGNTREVLCFEEDPTHQAARRFGADESSFGYANIYLDHDLGAKEKDLYGSYWRHNLGRQLRLRELLGERQGDLDANGMAGILADTGPTDCRIREAIAMVMTVGSVVFRPEDGTLWIGNGEAPTSHTAFEAFSLETMDHAPERGTLTGGIPADEDAATAFQLYREAYLAYFDGEDRGKAEALMERACELQPEQSLYHVVVGLLALGSDPQSAMERFSLALSIGHVDEEREAAARLWRGRAADLVGRRDEAISDYRAVLGMNADAPVRHAAKTNLTRPYRAKQARRIDVDFAYADVVKP